MADTCAEAAIGASEDVFATDQFRVTDQSLGHQVWILDEIGAMADDAGNQGGTLGQLHVLEHPPFVFMAWVGGFDRKASGIHPEDQVDDVPERDVIVMGPWWLPQQTCRRTFSRGMPCRA